MYPAYLEANINGKLDKIIKQAFSLMESCVLCPRKCKVNRLKDKRGFCKTGLKPKVYSFIAHHGEEPPISGKNGSGTIFFSNCNMHCVYCQNYEFSQEEKGGREVDSEELVKIMLELQKVGCHNLNFVTPTHVMPQILKALKLAIPKGLRIPLVYNTGGYELAQIIKLLDGIVDIYLPDMRYADADTAIKYSRAADYPEYNRQAMQEMHRQVGIPDIDEEGVIKGGVVIRHLILPNNISGTDAIMKFIAQELSEDSYISLMSQYMPCYKASQFKEINRRITYQEYEDAQKVMQKYGLYNGWIQESYGLDRFAGIHIKPKQVK
jgi:putative pyruvate formate lyase activating enzyme